MPAGFKPASVTFVSDQVGWVLGTAPCTHKPCTSIVRTVDGGASWRGIPAPKASLSVASGDPSAIDQLRFADRRDGYADGAGLWETHNGGATWARQRTVAGIGRAFVGDLAVAGRSVYALVTGTDPKYGGSDSHLRLARADVATGRFSVIADLGRNREADKLTAADNVVYLRTVRIRGRGNGTLVRVTGRTLHRTNLPVAGCDELTASTARALLLVCGGGAATGAMGTRKLYGSADSGRTFHRLRSPGRGAGYDTEGVADAGGGHAVIATVGAAAGILRSTDNGARSWHTSLEIPNGEFNDLGFEDHHQGVVVVSAYRAHHHLASLYRTRDGGSSWTRLTISR